MIKNGDFQKVAWVYVIDGYKRNWKTLWLIKEPVLRRAFIGYINSYHRSMNRGDELILEDAISRLERTRII